MKANHPRRRYRHLLAGLLPMAAAAALASCSSPSPSPAPAPAPPVPVRPAPPPPPPRPVAPAPADWRDAPQTEGRWYWAMEGERSIAQYAARGAAPVASLTCDPAQGTMILWRTGRATAEVPLVVTTTSTRKMLGAAPAASGGAAASLVPTDPLLDAIAFSRGRFMLEMTGGTTLYLPSWPEISRVIEDCRGLSARPAQQPAQPGPGSRPKR